MCERKGGGGRTLVRSQIFMVGNVGNLSTLWICKLLDIKWYDMAHSCVCDVTHSYVWHDSFMCMTRLIRMRDVTHSRLWHDSFMCVTWLFHACDLTHSIHVACDVTPTYTPTHPLTLTCCNYQQIGKTEESVKTYASRRNESFSPRLYTSLGLPLPLL